MLGYNLFLYCGNNPVRFSDDEGTFWDIALDVVFTIGSVINVIQNPTSGKAWAALGIDIICMAVPFVLGGGTALRVASKVDDVVDADRAVNQVDNIVDAGQTVSKGKGFNSYNSLKKYIGSPGIGNEWHHIVEQSQINKSGFEVESIQNTCNIISIDRKTHRAISGYYSSIQPFTDGKIVRNWLAGQSYDAQYQFGMDVIHLFI